MSSLSQHIGAAQVTSDVIKAQLRDMIAKLGRYSTKTGKFLLLLNTWAAKFTNKDITVYPETLHVLGQKQMKGSTITQFTKHLRGEVMIKMGLVVMWTMTPVANTVKDWAAEELHANPGKALVIGDPNIRKTQERRMEKLVLVRMVKMAKIVNFVMKDAWSLWFNTLRSERNDEGICLTLVLEWMLEIVIGGGSWVGW
ncbi:hypothetical protein K438DRAFT_1984227 [Mycena galopus ATCC 62051]|nr:hypothetical protein K438DRAFT_1984227 [Mycena galopus ATCC 62051]